MPGHLGIGFSTCLDDLLLFCIICAFWIVSLVTPDEYFLSESGCRIYLFSFYSRPRAGTIDSGSCFLACVEPFCRSYKEKIQYYGS